MKYGVTNLTDALQRIEALTDVEQEFLNQWIELIVELYHAQSKLDNFVLTLSVRQKKPKFGEIRFSYDDLSKYDYLKKYTGDYGFVVPTMGSRTKRILKGEKRLKYF